MFAHPEERIRLATKKQTRLKPTATFQPEFIHISQVGGELDGGGGGEGVVVVVVVVVPLG